MKTVIMYTDGACAGNQHEENIGGWGCILQYKEHEKELWGGEENTTNNRMELTAPIQGLSALKEKGLRILIYSDSSYFVNCFRKKWYKSWQKNGWRTAAKKPVENRDLWEKLLELTEEQNCEFYLVRGHIKIRESEYGKEDPALLRAHDEFMEQNGDISLKDFKIIAANNNRADELANEFIRRSRQEFENREVENEEED